MKEYDAIVIGAGPNGLSAAIRLTQRGLSVQVVEAADTIGGGTRTQELTLPGFRHDVCSAIHPMAAGSPFFNSLPFEEHGLEWLHAPVELAHPLDREPAAALYRSIDRTADGLGVDGPAWRELVEELSDHWDSMAPDFLGPLSLLPSHPVRMARFGLQALRPAENLAGSAFRTGRAKALFGGLAAHSLLPLDWISSSAIGLVLGAAAHRFGWPFPKGGSEAITRSLASLLESLGGEIRTGFRVETLDQLPDHRMVLFNLSPRQILRIADNKLPSGYRRKLERFRYGAGVFKLDLALDGPLPWSDPVCGQAATVHLGGGLEEIAASERLMSRGEHSESPYVLLAQQSLFDPTRAPEGKHAVWAYCHVPNGSTVDMTEPILQQIERFAPGARDLVLDLHGMNTRDMQSYNMNYIGGDINGGRQDITQLFTRPAGLLNPYRIPGTPMFICSASTPPGGGVHGMCGYHAAGAALKYMDAPQLNHA